MAVSSQFPYVVCASALALLACRTTSSGAVNPEFPDYDDLSLRGYAEEMLIGYGTPRTHRFDSYTDGVFSGTSPELIAELFRAAPIYGLDLQAVVIIGPIDLALWTTYTITYYQADGCTKVNVLKEPHGRITEKRSGCIDPSVAEASLRHFMGFTKPGVELTLKSGCVVFGERDRILISESDCYSSSTALKEIVGTLNNLALQLETTYAHPH
jgi:hypothetical protein